MGLEDVQVRLRNPGRDEQKNKYMEGAGTSPEAAVLRSGVEAISDIEDRTGTVSAAEERAEAISEIETRAGTVPGVEDRGGAEPEAADRAEAEPDDETLVAALQAVLFAMGEAVPIGEIAKAFRVPQARAERAADILAERCRRPGSGLILNWYEDAVQLSTDPALYRYLLRIASEPKKPKLTPTLLETLSIVAFRQPVTRMEVENIRGVNSDFAISRLVSYDLVQEVGRKEVPGRPLLFGTTEQFLRSFGIRSVEELPAPDVSQMEIFREEAEEEITSKLDV